MASAILMQIIDENRNVLAETTISYELAMKCQTIANLINDLEIDFETFKIPIPELHDVRGFKVHIDSQLLKLFVLLLDQNSNEKMHSVIDQSLKEPLYMSRCLKHREIMYMFILANYLESKDLLDSFASYCAKSVINGIISLQFGE